MQGKNHQISILLVGLALIYIVGYSSEKYNFAVRDDEIAAMSATNDKGILYIYWDQWRVLQNFEFVCLNIYRVSSIFPGKAIQPEFEPPIALISRVGSVGSGNSCTTAGDICRYDSQCCSRVCKGFCEWIHILQTVISTKSKYVSK